jgi:RNA polymerase sigma-70 factor (ECF subfamily)
MTTDEFNKCVDFYSDGLYRFILQNMKDRSEAQDIVQDAFEKVWIKHEEISFEKAKSYLFSAGYHIMIDRIRRLKRQAEMIVGERFESGYTNQDFDVKDIIDEAVGRLPQIQRTVIMLRDYEGYSYEEIGKITGLNESQVKVYIYRARLFLKDFLVSTENII